MIQYYSYNTDAMAQEMIWFAIGLVAGVVFMALVDFVIDRCKK